MKVILLENIKRIGRKYEVRQVPDGHALNYLIPQKLAEPATPKNLKRLELRASQKAEEERADHAHFETLIKTLTEKPITMPAAANEKGHLFKGLHEADIASWLEKSVGVPVSAHTIVLEKPIKEVGEHTVGLLLGDTKGSVTIVVTPE